MKRSMTLVAVHLLALSTAAQTSICGGFNHLTNQENAVVMTTGNWLAVLFTPASSIQIDNLQFRFFVPSTGVVSANAASGRCEIRTADPATGLPSGNVLAGQTFGSNGIATALGGGWKGPTFAPPIVLTQGQLYYLVYSKSTTGTAQLGAENAPAGPDVTPSSTSTDGITWTALATQNQWKVRLRDTTGGACAPPGPLASVSALGPGCGGVGGQVPLVTPVGLPVLGSTTFGLSLDAGVTAASLPYGLFWSQAGVPTGLPLGGGCVLWLEPTSTLFLYAQGLNPLFAGSLSPLGQANFLLPIPNDPALAGLPFGAQAVILAPYGVPTTVPGINFILSDAVKIQPGF